jgi:hypothetical protein
MTTNCQECGKNYSPETVVVLNPLPDKTCYICMNNLTNEEIASIAARLGIKLPETGTTFKE